MTDDDVTRAARVLHGHDHAMMRAIEWNRLTEHARELYETRALQVIDEFHGNAAACFSATVDEIRPLIAAVKQHLADNPGAPDEKVLAQWVGHMSDVMSTREAADKEQE